MRTANRVSAFTLVEMLVVLAIISVLLSLVIGVGIHIKNWARKVNTQALTSRLSTALEEYRSQNRDYPPISSETWPQPSPLPGVELDLRWIAGCSGWKDFVPDPSDRNRICDVWGHRIRYRKLAPERILVWSLGPDGVDQTGLDPKSREEYDGNDDINQRTKY